MIIHFVFVSTRVAAAPLFAGFSLWRPQGRSAVFSRLERRVVSVLDIDYSFAPLVATLTLSILRVAPMRSMLVSEPAHALDKTDDDFPKLFEL